ncbi:MAG: PAS domain-containing protein [Bacteroidota bacterium]|jgi:two-component system sensor histidine kinase UhpB
MKDFITKTRSLISLNLLSGGKVLKPDEDILVQKGNQLHELILLLVLGYSLIFSVINYVLFNFVQGVITATPLIFVPLEYYIYKKGYPLLSKTLNMFFVCSLIGALSLVTTPETGILSFFIPCFLGSLITFQGKEQPYAYLLTFFGFLYLLFFLLTDIRIYDGKPLTDEQIQTEWLMNFGGASVATIFQVVFVLLVSNKLQQNLINASDELQKKNMALSEALHANVEQTGQIQSQLEKIRKSELELAKLSLIAKKTKNGVIISDKYGRVEWVNNAFVEMSGYSLSEIMGKKPKDFLRRPDQLSEQFDLLSEKLQKKEFVETTIVNYKKDGSSYYNRLEIIPVFDDQGVHTNFIAIQRDITSDYIYEQKLLAANERYETVVNDVTNDIIWESDIQKGTIQFGSGMQHNFGYTPDQIGKDIEWALSRFHPEDRLAIESLVEECFKHKRPRWEAECRYLTADGKYKFVRDRGFIIYDQDGIPLRMIGAITDITNQKELERKVLEQKINEQKLMTEITIQSQEKEKSELGAELHDNINQILAAAKMYLDLYAAKLPVYDPAIQKSHFNIDLALQEIRKLSHSLVTPTLGNRDLFQAIKDLVSDMTQAAGVEIIFENGLAEDIELTDTRKLVLYRIVQEHMNNIIKYAKASQVKISLRSADDKVYLTLQDDGLGFDLSKKTKGIGFKNILNRVQLYSGEMNVETEPGKGCTLEVYIHLT